MKVVMLISVILQVVALVGVWVWLIRDHTERRKKERERIF